MLHLHEASVQWRPTDGIEKWKKPNPRRGSSQWPLCHKACALPLCYNHCLLSCFSCHASGSDFVLAFLPIGQIICIAFVEGEREKLIFCFLGCVSNFLISWLTEGRKFLGLRGSQNNKKVFEATLWLGFVLDVISGTSRSNYLKPQIQQKLNPAF